MKTIQLTQGYVAMVNDEDYARLVPYAWQVRSSTHKNGVLFYAQRVFCDPDGNQHSVLMHRMIMNAPRGRRVDHRDGNGLNNQRRENLRFATQSQNLANQRKTRGTSRFKGVCWDRNRQKWIVYAGRGGHVGRFDSEADAAHAYNIAAKARWGEFARLNDV